MKFEPSTNPKRTAKHERNTREEIMLDWEWGIDNRFAAPLRFMYVAEG